MNRKENNQILNYCCSMDAKITISNEKTYYEYYIFFQCLCCEQCHSEKSVRIVRFGNVNFSVYIVGSQGNVNSWVTIFCSSGSIRSRAGKDPNNLILSFIHSHIVQMRNSNRSKLYYL